MQVVASQWLVRVILVSLGLASSSASLAQPPGGWPNWRGPLHSGVAPDADPPVRWSETENVAFKIPIPGESLSSPIVVGDRVFVVTATALDVETYAANLQVAQGVVDRGEWPPNVAPVAHQFKVYAFDRYTGQLSWERLATERVPHESHYLDSSFACASPLSDGERLYVHFGSNGTYAYDLEGTLLWSIDLGDMRSRRGFGEASSPTLAGDLLIINWDHEDDSFIVALDKKSGREVWRTERPGEVSSWSTPLAVRHGGGLQIVVSSTGKSRGYEVETGEELWRLGGMTVNQIPTPLFRDGVIYLASGYRGSMLQAIDADRARGDLEGSEAVLWTYERDTPYVATPLLYGQNLYFVKHFRNVLTVLDPVTGDVRYGPVRLAGLGDIYASPVAAAGRVYFFDRRGRALVLRNGPSLEVIESNEIAEDVDGTPALVGKWMYLRSRGSLYAFRDDAGE